MASALNSFVNFVLFSFSFIWHLAFFDFTLSKVSVNIKPFQVVNDKVTIAERVDDRLIRVKMKASVLRKVGVSAIASYKRLAQWLEVIIKEKVAKERIS